MTRCSSILTNPNKFPMAVSRISHHPLGPVIRRDVCVELMPKTVDPIVRSRRGNFTRWSLFG